MAVNDRKADIIESGDSIFFVCEGDKSEPNFIKDFIEAWREVHGIGYSYRIWPAPVEEKKTDDESDKVVSVTSRNTGGRKSKNVDKNIDIIESEEVDEPASGGNPLIWVKYAEEKLEFFSEVYVIFDKDGHPFSDKAFERVKELKENKKKIDIYFSSRSFEYYLLQHFERIYQAFDKTECGEKVYSKSRKKGHTRYFNCCLETAVPGKACDGDICINGYARKCGYWKDSKGSDNFKIAGNIWRGIVNAEYVRRRAIFENPKEPYFLLNPYLDFQLLLVKLMGFVFFNEFNKELLHDTGHNTVHVIRNEVDSIVAINNSVLPMKLGKGWIKVFSVPKSWSAKSFDFKIIKEFSEIMLESNEKYVVKTDEILTSTDEIAIIEYKDKKALFVKF